MGQVVCSPRRSSLLFLLRNLVLDHFPPCFYVQGPFLRLQMHSLIYRLHRLLRNHNWLVLDEKCSSDLEELLLRPCQTALSEVFVVPFPTPERIPLKVHHQNRKESLLFCFQRFVEVPSFSFSEDWLLRVHHLIHQKLKQINIWLRNLY